MHGVSDRAGLKLERSFLKLRVMLYYGGRSICCHRRNPKPTIRGFYFGCHLHRNPEQIPSLERRIIAPKYQLQGPYPDSAKNYDADVNHPKGFPNLSL